MNSRRPSYIARLEVSELHCVPKSEKCSSPSNHEKILYCNCTEHIAHCKWPNNKIGTSIHLIWIFILSGCLKTTFELCLLSASGTVTVSEASYFHRFYDHAFLTANFGVVHWTRNRNKKTPTTTITTNSTLQPTHHLQSFMYLKFWCRSHLFLLCYNSQCQGTLLTVRLLLSCNSPYFHTKYFMISIPVYGPPYFLEALWRSRFGQYVENRKT